MRALAGTRARSRPVREEVSGAENRRVECGAMCGMLWEGGDLEGRSAKLRLSWCQREITQLGALLSAVHPTARTA